MSNTYEPSIGDILIVRDILNSRTTQGHSIGLPTELIDDILDFAEYWPHTLSELTAKQRAKGGHGDGKGGEPHGNILCITTPPLGLPPSPQDSGTALDLGYPIGLGWEQPRSEHPCRKIIFEICSRGTTQGSENDDPYEGSWTWFDAEISPPVSERSLRPGVPCQYDPSCMKAPNLLPSSSKLQTNNRVRGNTSTYLITLSRNDSGDPEGREGDDAAAEGRGRETVTGELVRSMKVGDCIDLWARARFPSWNNDVERASIKVFWAI